MVLLPAYWDQHPLKDCGASVHICGSHWIQNESLLARHCRYTPVSRQGRRAANRRNYGTSINRYPLIQTNDGRPAEGNEQHHRRLSSRECRSLPDAMPRGLSLRESLVSIIIIISSSTSSNNKGSSSTTSRIIISIISSCVQRK